jgi:NAD(P)-dependent dehydrogenase (short-subunit alcohol dehydrogenase family)
MLLLAAPLDTRAVNGATERRSVVVTGASTGIGSATVADLVRHGFDVWATVRRQQDADRLTVEHGDAVRPLQMDLKDHDSVRAAGATVTAAGPLHGLVNNAGVALPGPLEYLPIDVFRRQLDINVVGQLLVTQVMLPALFAGSQQHGSARIVMIGSIAGRIAVPVLGAYASAKHGLVGLTGTLRAELAPSGIQVFLIEPGAISTPIWSRGSAAGEQIVVPPGAQERYEPMLRAARDIAKDGNEKGLPPIAVAEVIRATLTDRKPPPRRVIGREARITAAMVRILPFRVLYRLLQGGRRPERRQPGPPSLQHSIC